MATIFEQLEQGLTSSDLTSSLGSQVGNLAGIGSAVSGLASHPPSSIGDFGSALSQLPLPQLTGGNDLLGSLTSVQGALPSDLSSVTGDLTSGLGSIGTAVTTLTTTLASALQGVLAVAKIAQTDFRCEPAPAGGGGGGGGAAAVAVAVAEAEAAAGLLRLPRRIRPRRSSSTRSAVSSTSCRRTSTSAACSGCSTRRSTGRAGTSSRRSCR